MKIFTVDAIECEGDAEAMATKRRVTLKLVQCEDCSCFLLADNVQHYSLYTMKGDVDRVACPRCYNDWRREAFS